MQLALLGAIQFMHLASDPWVEKKRDVYLDVKDISFGKIHSSVTTEGEIVTPTAALNISLSRLKPTRIQLALLN